MANETEKTTPVRRISLFLSPSEARLVVLLFMKEKAVLEFDVGTLISIHHNIGTTMESIDPIEIATKLNILHKQVGCCSTCIHKD